MTSKLYTMRVIILLFLFKVSSCLCQDFNQSISIDNFDSQIKYFDFSNINEVPDEDYKNAIASIKLIEKTLLTKNGEFSASIYWNYCHVFYTLQHFDMIEAPLVKAFSSNDAVICELFNLGHASIYQPYIQVSFWNNFESLCDESLGFSDKEENKFDTIENRQIADLDYYRERLVSIGNKDQQRTKIDWVTQNNLDSVNRAELDLLFDTYGFPSLNVVGEDAFTSAIMVLHHSSDCEWNEKWLLRFFNNYQDLSKYKNLINFFILRTFGPEIGICDLSQIAINSLTTKYNKEVLQTYGLDKLLRK